jgi:hypothetical protein
MERKRGWIYFTLAALMAIVMVSITAYGGWVETDANGDITYISGDKVKSVSKEEVGWTIFDFKSNSMTMVNPEEKSYSRMTVDEYCSFISKMMGGMTAEQRAMIEQMMKKQKAPKVVVKKVGSGGKVAGYSSDMYSVVIDGSPRGKVWISTDGALNRDAGRIMKKIFAYTSKMKKCSSMGGGSGGFEDTKAYQDLLKKGWVLKELMDGKVESEVVKLEKKRVPESEFMVPAGFTLKPLKDFIK